MPGLNTTPESSLERLKALDNLPSLDAQLAEIQQLCTHSARAEMIARWLCGKLSSDAKAKQNASVWNRLTATLRILPVERIAAILGGSKILKVLQDSFYLADGDLELFTSRVHLLRLLFEQSDGLAGVPLAAVLTRPATEAAEFAGALLQAARTISMLGKGDPADELCGGIRAALLIWALRKRSQNDNEAFSKHCLAACSALLTFQSQSGTKTPENKRSHDTDYTRSSPTSDIESLLARHIFLPGRAAFFKARGSSNARQVGSQRPDFTIESLLDPLGNACLGNTNYAVACRAALPQLLEVALRSAPTPSPSQRSHEKPWIETLFLALHGLNRAPREQVHDVGALSGMLAAMAKRSCTLSADVLQDVVQNHARLGIATTDNVDWDLVAGVVDVDAGFFKDEQKARGLFTAITAASISLGENEGNVSENEDNVDEYAALLRLRWKHRIVVPVLRAFARFNDLTTVLELCSEQLKKDLHGTFWSVWNELDEPIQELLEDSLMPDKALAVCLEYCQTIKSFNSNRNVDKIEELSAAIVMLNAILGGVRREETLDRLHDSLEDTFKALMELHDAHIGPRLIRALMERDCWSLMATIFQLWFPRWTSQEIEATAILVKMDSLVPQSALTRAVELSSTVTPEVDESVEDPRSAADAKCFAARICTQMLAYKGMVEADSLARYVEVLDTLGRQFERDRSMAKLAGDALVLQPGTFNYMNSRSRQELLQAYMSDGVNAQLKTTAPECGVIRAVSSAASCLESTQAVDDLVGSALACLDHRKAGTKGDLEDAGALLVANLSTLPPKALNRTQREKILDYVCNRRKDDQAAFVRMLRSCLPLMLRLMQLANPTARVCLEPALVTSIAEALDEVQDPRSETDDVTPGYFQELVSLILQQCIRTKDQERSQQILAGLSSEAASIMKSKRVSSKSQSAHQCALIRAVCNDLESNGLDSIKTGLAHRTPSAVKKLLGSIEKVLGKSLQSSGPDALSSLELLQAIPATLIQDSGYDIVPLLASLAGFLETTLDTTDESTTSRTNGQDSLSLTPGVAVRCYQILGKLATTVNTRLASFAVRLLELPLEPREHAAVLSTFEDMLTGLGASRTVLAQELLSSGSDMPASRLLLVQLANGRLEKGDFDVENNSPPTGLLHRLLMIVSTSQDFTVTRRALACATDILKSKTFMVNQYNVEVALQVLHHLAQRNGAGKTILYLDICTTTSVLLLHHRSRLQGRFHILIKLLQTLLARLFQPLQGWDKETTHRPPTTKHAQALSRLLKLFCEPPQHQRPRNSTTATLVDESRRQQAHVGTFVQHVLHGYCTQILHGTLGEGMKDALMTPGLAAVIAAMEMGGAEGGKALSAAMGNAERAVLRGLYEEWRRFGKWRGG